MVTKNPYQTLPIYTRWTKSVAGIPMEQLDPVVDFPFTITESDKISTAGSCFAQHIARYLKLNGFNYFITEEANPIMASVPDLDKKYNYGTFSARYGNIYTSRQLVQTFKRAYGTFTPSEEYWVNNDYYIDPFRPVIQPNGFASLQELKSDREQHFAAIRKMFEELDYFVFTLGLTEHWYCREDNAVLPVCPGVSGGVYSPEKYGFGNFGVNEVLADMEEFYKLLKSVNSNAKIIITVSPVPLAATAEHKHVLVSTTYSKSVLRVVSEMFSNNHEDVAYFPAFEIITGNYNRGSYYANNLRDVLESGVEHVMKLFLKHGTNINTNSLDEEKVPQTNDANTQKTFYQEMNNVIETVCEEALIEASLSENDN